MKTTNLFVIANVKQLRTGGSFRILLPFFRTSWGVGVLNSAIFNSFHNRVGFDTILEDLRNFRGEGGVNPQTPPPPQYATGGQRHAPAALPPGKRPGAHRIGGWVGPKACLDGCGKSRPDRDSIPGPSIP